MISVLVSLLIMVLIAGVIYMIIGMIPMPPTFKQIAYVILAVICLLYLLGMLTGSVGPMRLGTSLN